MDTLEWLKVLETKLSQQATNIAVYETYFEGRQTAGIELLSTAKYSEFFYGMFRNVNDNWLPIVVDAVDERLSVQGFRIADENADDDAWKIWQYNNFDIQSKALFSTILTCGLAYVMVWHSGDDQYPVLMTPEHPSEVFVAIDSETGFRLAGIKRWIDEWTGDTRVNLYFPDRIDKFIKPKNAPRGVGTKDNPYVLITSIPNPLGVVPIVPYRNRITLRRSSYKSELHDVLSTQDQINKLVMDMLIASEFSAFRQRWATGFDVPTDPETGQPVETFKAAMDRLWTLSDPTARFGEFSATDLNNFIRAWESRTQSLASRSRTPSHYMIGVSNNIISGEGLKTTETGLIAKTKRHQLEYSDPLEETIRLAYAVLNDSRSKVRDSEVIWGDCESRTESEHIDATVKKIALGIPMQQLQLDAGYTVTQIKQFQQMLIDEAVFRASLPQSALPPVNDGMSMDNLGASNGPLAEEPPSVASSAGL